MEESDDSDDILYKNPRAGADIFERSYVENKKRAITIGVTPEAIEE